MSGLRNICNSDNECNNNDNNRYSNNNDDDVFDAADNDYNNYDKM